MNSNVMPKHEKIHDDVQNSNGLTLYLKNRNKKSHFHEGMYDASICFSSFERNLACKSITRFRDLQA